MNTMPVNEILAPYYLKVKYNTQVARHLMHLYFQVGSTLVEPGLANPNDWLIQGPGGLTNTRISEVVKGVFNRRPTNLNTGTALEEIQIWQGGAGVTNFLHNNILPTGSLGASAAGVAAAYLTFMFSTPSRAKFRLNFYDTNTASPQRDAGGTPPLVDDGDLPWWMVNNIIPFATNDGERLTQFFSINRGYNRRLARRYGRQISP
jgi:hypothetical protein